MVGSRNEEKIASTSVIEAAAQSGAPNAKYLLALRLLNPDGPATNASPKTALRPTDAGGASDTFLPRDAERAVALLEEACDAGVVGAKYSLAVCLETGDGCRRDRARARRLYEEAAKHGHAPSMNNLALCVLDAGSKKGPLPDHVNPPEGGAAGRGTGRDNLGQGHVEDASPPPPQAPVSSTSTGRSPVAGHTKNPGLPAAAALRSGIPHVSSSSSESPDESKSGSAEPSPQRKILLDTSGVDVPPAGARNYRDEGVGSGPSIVSMGVSSTASDSLYALDGTLLGSPCGGDRERSGPITLGFDLLQSPGVRCRDAPRSGRDGSSSILAPPSVLVGPDADSLVSRGAIAAGGDRGDGAGADHHGAAGETLAAQMFREAHEAGYSRSTFNLAVCLDEGRGVEADPAEALRLFRAAADNGDLDALNRVGVSLRAGRGTPRDPHAAAVAFERAAIGGQLDACFNLAQCHASGEVGRVDHAEAARLWRGAAEKGHVKSMYQYGKCLVEKKGVEERDIPGATAFFEGASERGHVRAKLALALILMRGADGVPQDRARAVTLLAGASDAGNVKAMVHLGRCLELGDGCPADLEAAMEQYERAAVRGSLPGCYHLGRCLEDSTAARSSGRTTLHRGDSGLARRSDLIPISDAAKLARAAALYAKAAGCPDVLDDGAAWSSGTTSASTAAAGAAAEAVAAAEAGSPDRVARRGDADKNVDVAIEGDNIEALAFVSGRSRGRGNGQGRRGGGGPASAPPRTGGTVPGAKFRLGRFLRSGVAGLPRDLETAHRLFAEASEDGVVPATVELGLCFQNGRGCEVDPVHAETLFRDAAVRGDVDGLYNYAICCEQAGRAEEAMARYDEASSLGHTGASVNLALLLLGQGDPPQGRDVSRALEMLESAARAGDADACFNLGVCLDTGKAGIPPDPARAANLYAQAADAGHPGAMFNLAMLHETGDWGPGDPRNGKPDHTKARVLLEEAVALGELHAATALGMMRERVGDVDGAADLFLLAGTDEALELFADLPKKAQRDALARR